MYDEIVMKIRPESGFKIHDDPPYLCCYRAESPAEGLICEWVIPFGFNQNLEKLEVHISYFFKLDILGHTHQKRWCECLRSC